MTVSYLSFVMNCYDVKLYFAEYIKLKGEMTDKDNRNNGNIKCVVRASNGPDNGFPEF